MLRPLDQKIGSVAFYFGWKTRITLLSFFLISVFLALHPLQL